MIRAAVLEDTPADRKRLTSYLRKYCEDRKESLTLKEYVNGSDFLDEYRYDCDVVFIDIQLLGLDGISAAKELRGRDKNVCIMFITNMIQFAVNGYEVAAMGYLIKPIAYQAFKIYMDKIVAKVRENQSEYAVTVEVRDAVYRIPLCDLYYVESMDHYLLWHTKDREIKALGKLSDIEGDLTKHNFYRCGQSYLVNMRYVSALDGAECIVNGSRIAVSRRKRKDFLHALNAYWSRGGD